MMEDGERGSLSEKLQGRCTTLRSDIRPPIGPQTSTFLLPRPPQLMTYKQYADMVRFLHHACGNGVLELTGLGAARSEKEIKSKDAFLCTLAVHLHRLQRYAGTAVGSNLCALAHGSLWCLRPYTGQFFQYGVVFKMVACSGLPILLWGNSTAITPVLLQHFLSS